MNDIKVWDTIKDLEDEAQALSTPLGFFAEAVAISRREPGVSIENIGKCFRFQFDEAELTALIKELNKGKL